jgi:outer membrane lipoprotein LolB
MNNYRVHFIIILAVFLSACGTTPTGPITPPPSSADAITKWETSGRVGIRTPDDAVSGNFNWQKSSTEFALKIVGPFGQGATKLNQSENGTITLAYEDKVITGRDSAQLLQQELGWEFPVNQVTYWIRGLASPISAAQISTDPDTKLPNEIAQDGWLISYSSFIKVDGLSLPKKMQVSKPPFKVNLIINKWTIQ